MDEWVGGWMGMQMGVWMDVGRDCLFVPNCPDPK